MEKYLSNQFSEPNINKCTLITNKKYTKNFFFATNKAILFKIEQIVIFKLTTNKNINLTCFRVSKLMIKFTFLEFSD